MDLVWRLSFLFGTEEAINNRKLLVLLREKIWIIASKGPLICSGSLGEGVNYPRSDDDIMLIDHRQSYRVYESYEEARQNRENFFIPSVYSPGFCVIQDTNEGEFSVLSSKQYREKFVQSWTEDSVEHGPCASYKEGENEYDYALCLSCSSCTTIANEWIVRNRVNDWPSQELIRTIVMGGCHFVPIGNPDSPLRDFEWRVSFSLAERSLIHKFNHVQFLVYNLLKLVLKKVIEIRIPNVLCSYFMKTVMFFVIENNTPTLWVYDRIEDCYRKSLLLLYHFIDNMECPNYFIPGTNMMRRKVNTNNRAPLLDIVHELMTLGIVGSLYSCCERKVKICLSRDISLADIEQIEDNDFCYGYLLDRIKRESSYFIRKNTSQHNLQHSVGTLLLPIILNFKYTSESIISLVIRYVFLRVGLKCFQISQRMRKANKARYQMLQQGQALLIKGCNTDISSGRLLLANYMYATGRFHYALAIIQLILSKCAPYVISPESHRAHEDLYMEILCNKNYSLMYKLRRGWALRVNPALHNTDLTPDVIRILKSVSDHVISISPIVYAYFLQGLCFYESRDMIRMKISVTSLEDTVRNLPSCCCATDKFYGRFLLGYMKMLQRDYHSSCSHLIAAYLMTEEIYIKGHGIDNSKPAYSCVTLLACLLNRIWKRTM